MNEFYFDETNIHEANLFMFNIESDYLSINYFWEEHDKSENEYHGLEIPTNINWHNGKDYDNPNNYYKIHLIAIKNWYYRFYNYNKSISMTDLKNRRYENIMQRIGQLIYSQDEVIDNKICILSSSQVCELKSMQKKKNHNAFTNKENDKLMNTYVILGIKFIQYKKFPTYKKFIDVIGPRESYFID